jgi:phospholipid N-methyltransferase
MKYLEAIPGVSRVRRKSASTIASLLSSYATIGAVCESSRWLARGMEKAIGDSSLPIVELGAGYGSVTRVLPETTVSIERDLKRFEYLKGAYPNRTIIDTCAMVFLAGLQQATVVVSSIPSINNPEFGRLRASVALAHRAGTVATLITYTYFPHNPFAGIFPDSEMVGMEFLNMPPAFIWRYSC